MPHPLLINRRTFNHHLLLAIAAISAALPGCEEPAPIYSAHAPVPLGPVTSQYAELFNELESTDNSLLHIYPLRAGLELGDTAPPGERDRAVAALLAAQPIIQRLIALSVHKPEPPPSSLYGLGILPPGNYHRLFRALFTDASRCFDEGDHAGVAARLAAAARIADHLTHDTPTALVGIGKTSHIAMKAAALADGGSAAAWPDELRKTISDCLRAASSPDTASSMIANWKLDAKGNAELARREFATQGGPERLAELLAASPGREMLVALGFVLKDLDPATAAYQTASTAFNENVEKVRSMSPGSIRRRIDAAEALIAPCAKALASPDRKTALAPIAAHLDSDPTQVSKLIINGPWIILGLYDKNKVQIQTSLEKLNAATTPPAGNEPVTSSSRPQTPPG